MRGEAEVDWATLAHDGRSYLMKFSMHVICMYIIELLSPTIFPFLCIVSTLKTYYIIDFTNISFIFNFFVL